MKSQKTDVKQSEITRYAYFHGEQSLLRPLQSLPPLQQRELHLLEAAACAVTAASHYDCKNPSITRANSKLNRR